MRRPFIAGNWKMHTTQREARELVVSLRKGLDGLESIDVAVCPPFTALAIVREGLEGSRLTLGAQDLHWETKGAFTGEVSGSMLRDAGCTCVIVGHSERRHVLEEPDEFIRRKVVAATACGLTPILCVGEQLDEREKGSAKAVVERQMLSALEGLGPQQIASSIVAYEPVWAIGTGRNAMPAQAQEMHAFVRALLGKRAGTAIAQSVRILYGGSVKPDNIRELMAEADVDGALVGGASLEAASFSKICRFRE